MTRPWTIALRDYPHTTPLKEGAIRAEGVDLEFVEVEPINEAFGPMVRDSAYDISELAIATLFQAIEAGRPIVALPVVLHGNFHHRSISVLAGQHRIQPQELVGRRVGVRAYSQTTGLWVRGALADTYAVSAQDITWVTREGPHVAEAVDPANVERTDVKLVDLLAAQELAAVVMGARSADHIDSLVPLLPDWAEQQERHYADHGWVPINHLAVVRRELVESDPDGVRAVYRALQHSVDAARPVAPAGTPRELVVDYGITETLTSTLTTALRYAREQSVIQTQLGLEDVFGPFRELFDE